MENEKPNIEEEINLIKDTILYLSLENIMKNQYILGHQICVVRDVLFNKPENKESMENAIKIAQSDVEFNLEQMKELADKLIKLEKQKEESK